MSGFPPNTHRRRTRSSGAASGGFSLSFDTGSQAAALSDLNHHLSGMQLHDGSLRSASHPRRPGAALGRVAGGGRSVDLTIASYNILAQSLLEEHRELYLQCDDQHLGWRFRRQNIFQQLDAHQPDVICLQEVQRDHFNSCLMPHLRQHGYEGHYKQRTGDKRDGCATFFKQNKFTCINAVPIEYLVPGSSVLNRDNIALILVLEPVNSKSRIVVANTHILFNPGRGDVKLSQLMFLMAAIDEIAAHNFDLSPTYNPVIICGDLNLLPNSPLYGFITMGRLEYWNLYSGIMSGQEERAGKKLRDDFLEREVGVTDQSQFIELVTHRQHQSQDRYRHHGQPTFGSGTVTHPFHFAPAYQPRRNLLTTWFNGRGYGAMVDYIFYSVSDLRPSSFGAGQQTEMAAVEGKLKLVGILQLPSGNAIQKGGGLPNDTEPSDHLLIMARFSLQE